MCEKEQEAPPTQQANEYKMLPLHMDFKEFVSTVRQEGKLKRCWYIDLN